MDSKEKFLIEIIEKSASLEERITGDYLFRRAIDGNEIQKYIVRWNKIVANNRDDLFEKRLSLENLDINSVKPLLGKICFPPEKETPAWSKMLKKVKNIAEDFTYEDLKNKKDELFKHNQTIPFSELYVPFIMAAEEEIKKKTGKSYSALGTDKVPITFRNYLLSSLAYLTTPTLYEEFSIFSLTRETGFTRLLAQLTESYESDTYDDFIKELSENCFITFFREYPVLARLISTTIENWVGDVSHFFLRLDRDLQEISHKFCDGKDPGIIIRIEPALSDRHNSGRTVKSLTFKSGLKLVYKPKNLSGEVVYNDLLSSLNLNGTLLDFKTLKILNRDNYGWV